jgi:hypothetical protein
MHLARWRQHAAQHLLGGGLADRTGDRNDLRPRTRPCCKPKLAERTSTSSTTIIGTVSRPMAGNRASLTTSSAAPLAIAIDA